MRASGSVTARRARRRLRALEPSLRTGFLLHSHASLHLAQSLFFLLDFKLSTCWAMTICTNVLAIGDFGSKGERNKPHSPWTEGFCWKRRDQSQDSRGTCTSLFIDPNFLWLFSFYVVFWVTFRVPFSFTAGTLTFPPLGLPTFKKNSELPVKIWRTKENFIIKLLIQFLKTT